MNTYKKYSKLLLKKTHKKTHKKNQTFKNKKYGGGIFESIGSAIVHVPKKKNYTIKIPGSNIMNMLNPKTSTLFGNSSKQEFIKIIFNYHLDNQININDISPNTILSSNKIYKEPYVLINSMDKFLLVMYRIINKKNIPTPKFLLHWLIGYMNRMPTKIFNFIPPNPKVGKIHNFFIKLYKLPDINNKNFININNINKKKAYEEFISYIKSQNLLPIRSYSFMVKGSLGEGINLFNMFDKQKTKLGKY